eukprot:gene13239-13369_t
MSQLVLACHHVDSPTAKVLPSDGVTSVSLWDTEDPTGLQDWLNENLGGDCTTELHENWKLFQMHFWASKCVSGLPNAFQVQEDFTFGLSLELARVRAAEKVADSSLKTIGALGERTSKAAGMVAAGVSTAVGQTQHTLEAWDERTGVLTGAKERTAALQQKVVSALSKAAENERVQSVVQNVSTGVSSGWAKVSTWVGSRLQDLQVNDSGEYDQPPYQGMHANANTAQASATPYSQYHPSAQDVGHHTAESVERPLTFTDSMLDDPTLGSPPRGSSTNADGHISSAGPTPVVTVPASGAAGSLGPQ